MSACGTGFDSRTFFAWGYAPPAGLGHYRDHPVACGIPPYANGAGRANPLFNEGAPSCPS
jgi:hypothetical protein